MKIILSHDVDHLYWNEHFFNDLYVPGVLYRNTKGLFRKEIDFETYKKRISCFGRINRIPELINFYNEYGVKANFFFGMGNALNLSYNYKSVKPLINILSQNGHRVGVHGISFKDPKSIETEFLKFTEVSGIESFGIRTHYLRLSGYTHKLFESQGYLYDSSIDCLMHPFKVDEMWEIPISIMDASLVKNAQLNQDLSIWKQNALEQLEKAIQFGLPYFVVNFHDMYYSDGYPVIRDWFQWLFELLLNKYEFITFEQAVSELNNKYFDQHID